MLGVGRGEGMCFLLNLWDLNAVLMRDRIEAISRDMRVMAVGKSSSLF